jgi:hypothetical protein
VAAEVPDGDPGDLQRAAGPPLDVVGVVVEQAERGRAHRPAAQHPHANGVGHSQRPITISSS